MGHPNELGARQKFRFFLGIWIDVFGRIVVPPGVVPVRGPQPERIRPAPSPAWTPAPSKPPAEAAASETAPEAGSAEQAVAEAGAVERIESGMQVGCDQRVCATGGPEGVPLSIGDGGMKCRSACASSRHRRTAGESSSAYAGGSFKSVPTGSCVADTSSLRRPRARRAAHRRRARAHAVGTAGTTETACALVPARTPGTVSEGTGMSAGEAAAMEAATTSVEAGAGKSSAVRTTTTAGVAAAMLG
jgi:hypothetical protein